MDMEDDDEFGDLYTDVLRTVSTSPAPLPSSSPPAPSAPSPSPPNPSLRSDSDGGEARTLSEDSRPGRSPSATSQTLASYRKEAVGDADWILGPAPIPEEQLQDLNELNEEDDGVLAGNSSIGVSESHKEDALKTGAVKKEEAAEVVKLEDESEFRFSEAGEENLGLENGSADLDSGPVIPGLSAGPAVPGAFRGVNIRDVEALRSDDWDSDSGDDLQIVLNDDNYGRIGPDRGVGLGIADDDEDGEDDLVIVTDDDQHQHHHHAMEGQEWGKDSTQPPVDGEKDMSDAAKGTTVIAAASGSRAGYSGHGFHPQNHSQFKYIRPGASSVAGAGVPAQAHPPLSTLPLTGRGRGSQRGFHPDYGMTAWANNNSARPHGIGLEFTLPSHKTIFDVVIDSFEEKPWKHPGIDMSHFFNFGLDEDTWKGYCKQLDQLRLEATMQSKIRVYESGRSEQDYDPDLPPELAAATGLQDTLPGTVHVRGLEGGQLDLLDQGRGTTQIRPQLPTGRAIQVEGGSGGERLPSIDTRPPRIRDSDAIIEIVPQDTWDDSVPQNGVLEKRRSECGADSYKNGVCEGERNHTHNDHDRFAHIKNEKKEPVSGKMHSIQNNVPEEDGVAPFPQEEQSQHHSTSQIRGPSGTSHAGRHEPGRPPERYSNVSEGYSDDAPSGDSAKMDISNRKEKSGGHSEGNKGPELSPPATDLSIEDRDEELADRLALVESSEDEGDEIASDLEISGYPHDDNSSTHSIKKNKFPSQIDRGDLKTTVDDNATGKSESCKDFEKRIEGCEDEVLQDASSRDLRAFRKKADDNSQRRSDCGRDAKHAADCNHAASKGRGNLHHNHLSRGVNSDLAKIVGKADVSERSSGTGLGQRRDGDVHGRRTKDKNIKLERTEEIGSMHKRKIRAIEIKGEDRADDGYRKSHRDRSGPSQRQRDEMTMNRREKFDIHAKSRKDEERGKDCSKDNFHGSRIKEDTNRKRERDDSSEYRKKEDLVKPRDKTEDRHASRHRDEILRPKEDRQRVKHPHEEMRPHRERDLARGNRLLEKPYGGSGRSEDSLKGSFGADKDSLFGRRHNEHSKRGDQTAEEIRSEHERHKEVHTHKNQLNIEEKSSRNGRPRNHNNRALNASGSQHINREKNRENSGSKETHDEQNVIVPSKRKHHDDRMHKNVKIQRTNGSLKENNVKKANNPHHADEKPEASQVHFVKNDEKSASDEEIWESKKGRSKLERWTSHKERDYSSNNIQFSSSSLRGKEGNNNDADTIPQSGHLENEKNEVINPDTRDVSAVQLSDKDGSDRHLETVEKLKKRSERFKLPMPGEDTTVIKRIDNLASVASNRILPADSEIKLERPARKRRWVSR